MFELFVYTVVVIAVLAFSGQESGVNSKGKQFETQSTSPASIESQAEADLEIATLPEVPEVLEVAEVFTADEQIKTAVTTDYAAMSIADLKALGKQHNIPGWKAWKKPQTAIAKLEALAA